MQALQRFYRLFLTEPVWFKILVVSMLLIAVVFSSSAFDGTLRGSAKLVTCLNQM
ncbi:hypothetical protein QWJ34_12245 [Saccharibacillus sp. CPCC 101409]|uniref:hypothetical protein n=1 Tax=Saccharibacillus sp. CPCC 101409 TaxID=3058041 RepID=UPI002670DB87|nr:hypothetical protein [Saccharibacillus sp. CPCC 101409]MDO3410533.1 hypothetical protein [Saccharibacillus sp. CPCC 101409]